MNNLTPKYISHPELLEAIVGQFAFMKAMARPGDRMFKELQAINLNDVFDKADQYFIEFCEVEEIINTEESLMAEKITTFLQEWKAITDVTAIQQNIHNLLNQKNLT